MTARLLGFRGDRRAAAALEFALVGIPFVGLVVGLAVIALNAYLQVTLDRSLQRAVRQIQIGALPAATTGADFAAKVFCPAFAAFTACGSVAITVQPVPDYQTAAVVALSAVDRLAVSSGFCTGQPGQLMFARAVYLAPAVSQFWPYAAQVPGGTALIATAAFANENPLGAPIPAGGGC